VRVTFFLAIWAFCLAMAFWRGGQPEKAVALCFAVMIGLDAPIHLFFEDTYATINMAHFLIDAISWIALYLIALHAHRLWVLFVAALQTIALASHAVPILSLEMNPEVYGTMQVVASYPALALLLIGTWRHYRRKSMFGYDRAWSSSDPTKAHAASTHGVTDHRSS
jgi:hypothetical protein